MLIFPYNIYNGCFICVELACDVTSIQLVALFINSFFIYSLKTTGKGKTMAGQKILVIDDSPTQLKLILAPLQSQQYETLTAVDGEEGLAKALTEKPDLVVMDVVMPKMDGFQTCRKMKLSDELKHIPVIMLTSKNQKTDEFWGKKQGASEYLTKPFEDQQLLDAVARNLSQV